MTEVVFCKLNYLPPNACFPFFSLITIPRILLVMNYEILICSNCGYNSEEERSVDTFSPQIIEFLNSKNNNGGKNCFYLCNCKLL